MKYSIPFKAKDSMRERQPSLCVSVAATYVASFATRSIKAGE